MTHFIDAQTGKIYALSVLLLACADINKSHADYRVISD
ncbi:hypothetical protein AB54_4012 [Escherichia coli 2-011-08_S1_C3]|nr:hypothetical protein AB54_4012 [Escherichia coli 2-011-08_S1_C3]